MTEAAAPPARLPEPARAAVREVLLAELTAAAARARAAGCSPETLAAVFEGRRRRVGEDGARPER
ncbi:hypothetical protein [Amycolatopsis sp. CA-128772]|uniref:hypothetical protein n=1 Tax=Amycolatopsis sp. CA-128772 TaxID=2073159 RepID=UPI000CD1E6A8|nr:hypothetical protein [Amycolatopsis sp. CA-128772]